MNSTKELPIARDKGRALTRREAARQLLAFMASGTLAWTSASHPIWENLANEKVMEIAETSAKEGRLQFLSASQFESLAVLAEAIVPGSGKAESAEFIDVLLGIEKEKNQSEFAYSLSAFEAESVKRFAKKLSTIPAADVNTLLTDAASQPKSKEGAPPLRNSFENLKEWISGAYYSSEVGMRELGWTPDRVFSEFPGCTHSDHKG